MTSLRLSIVLAMTVALGPFAFAYLFAGIAQRKKQQSCTIINVGMKKGMGDMNRRILLSTLSPGLNLTRKTLVKFISLCALNSCALAVYADVYPYDYTYDSPYAYSNYYNCDCNVYPYCDNFNYYNYYPNYCAYNSTNDLAIGLLLTNDDFYGYPYYGYYNQPYYNYYYYPANYNNYVYPTNYTYPANYYPITTYPNYLGHHPYYPPYYNNSNPYWRNMHGGGQPMSMMPPSTMYGGRPHNQALTGATPNQNMLSTQHGAVPHGGKGQPLGGTTPTNSPGLTTTQAIKPKPSSQIPSHEVHTSAPSHLKHSNHMSSSSYIPGHNSRLMQTPMYLGPPIYHGHNAPMQMMHSGRLMQTPLYIGPPNMGPRQMPMGNPLFNNTPHEAMPMMNMPHGGGGGEIMMPHGGGGEMTMPHGGGGQMMMPHGMGGMGNDRHR